MIDLHHHLLPALDDGPATLEESVSAAQASAREGVRTIAATPHFRDDYPGVQPRELASRCTELSRVLLERRVGIEVVPGGEVDVSWAQDASDEDLRLVSYGQRGTDLLVETPYSHLPSTFEALLFGIQVRGYRVLLAHPERNRTFQGDPGRLAALVERGVLLQLTAGALTKGRTKSSSGRLARWLVKRRLAHVIASDTHGPSSRREPPSYAVAAAGRREGELARWMVTTAPAAVLAGEPLPPPPAH